MLAYKKLSVDVVIPVYMDSKNICSAIESALSQTYVVSHIYVVDDGSLDNTVDVINNSFVDNEIVSVIRRPHLGRSSARNHGISLCKSDLIAFLDSDDIWHPNKLEIQASIIASDPAIGCVYCSYQLMNGAGELIQDALVIEPTLKGSIFRYLLNANLISGSASAMLIRRNLLNLTGGFNTKLAYGEDWELWLKLSRITQYSFVEKKLVTLRTKLVQPRDNFFIKKFRDSQHLLIWSNWPNESADIPTVSTEIQNVYLKRSLKNGLSLKRRILILLSVYRWSRANERQRLFVLVFGNEIKPLRIILEEHFRQKISLYRNVLKKYYHLIRHLFFLSLRNARKSYHFFSHHIQLFLIFSKKIFINLLK